MSRLRHGSDRTSKTLPSIKKDPLPSEMGWEARLGSSSWADVQRSLKEAAASKDGSAIPAIISRLKREDSDIDRSIELFDALSMIGLNETQKRMVLSMAGSEDKDDRLLGIKILDYAPIPEAMPMLIGNIRSDDWEVIQYSCNAICGLYDSGIDCSDAIEAIYDRMSHEKDSGMRKYVLEHALLNLGQSEEMIRERCVDLVDLSNPLTLFMETWKALHLRIKERYERMTGQEIGFELSREVIRILERKVSRSDSDIDDAIKECLEASKKKN